MSYCRYSCDDSKSDVYVWHDVEGYWAIAVAELKFRRKNGELSFADPIPLKSPHAGKMFKCKTRKFCIIKLKTLRASGLHVPEKALIRLRQEILSEKRFDKRRK